MPRKGYGTITVKVESFNKFIKVKHAAKRENPDLDNSTFLESLLEHKKVKSMKHT
ncbi:MAG: hypothetical protein ACYC6W_01410 [Nitrosotalea sp.]